MYGQRAKEPAVGSAKTTWERNSWSNRAGAWGPLSKYNSRCSSHEVRTSRNAG
jgi:hypothetical protein